MILTFPNFTLDIDVEKTQAYYKIAKTVSEDCACNGCRNYEQAINYLPKEVPLYFTQLGIDMKKFREVYVNCTNSDDTIYYGGFTHVCGRVISKESALVPTSENIKYCGDEKMIFLTDDFNISYNEECHMLDDNFPFPAIQLEISANIPWVLAEKNDYVKNMER